MKLHPATWLVIACGGVSFAANLIDFADSARMLIHNYPTPQFEAYAASGWRTLITGSAREAAYSLSYVGTAAMIEFLFRIWRELKTASAGAAPD